MIQVKYFNRDTQKTVTKMLPCDSIEVTLPPSDDLPQLEVDVNTDGIFVIDGEGQRTHSNTFTEMLEQ